MPKDITPISLANSLALEAYAKRLEENRAVKNLPPLDYTINHVFKRFGDQVICIQHFPYPMMIFKVQKQRFIEGRIAEQWTFTLSEELEHCISQRIVPFATLLYPT